MSVIREHSRNGIWPQSIDGNGRVMKTTPSAKGTRSYSETGWRASFPPSPQPRELTGPKQHKRQRKQCLVTTAWSKTGRDRELVPPYRFPLLSPTWSYLSFFGNSYLLLGLRASLSAAFLPDVRGNFSVFWIFRDSGWLLVLMLSRASGPCLLLSVSLPAASARLVVLKWTAHRRDLGTKSWRCGSPAPLWPTAPPADAEERKGWRRHSTSRGMGS